MRPIGIFDSGFGGLTVFKSIEHLLPEYDYIYLGDNARAPYGNRSFETVYHYTLQCVKWFFTQNCPLIIIACNTASAKALRTIQQIDLPKMGVEKRVLGVIRPTAELIGHFTKTKKVGVLGTLGTVTSESYPTEINHFFPEIEVFQQACPLWVPFIENKNYQGEGVDFVIEQDLKELFAKCRDIDTILLACTHYPLLENKIRKYLPQNIQLISQGDIVAKSLKNYLLKHSALEKTISKHQTRAFYTTDAVNDFEEHASSFFGSDVKAEFLDLNTISLP